jgi:hypothetical protein
MNRLRCRTDDGETWTTVRVATLRERLGISAYDAVNQPRSTISADHAAARLGICVGSVQKLIRKGVLPATQRIPSAPWEIPLDVLETEAVQQGVRRIKERRPKVLQRNQEDRQPRLPSF